MQSESPRIVADVGNTEIAFGVVATSSEGRRVTADWRLSTTVTRTADELEHSLSFFLNRAGVDAKNTSRPVIGSVVPRITPALHEALHSVAGVEPFLLEGITDLGIQLDVEEPMSVGADRIANTLAAQELFARDTVVVDLGTATTFDCITAEGVFVGGVIAPGILSGLQRLGDGTAKLPAVAFSPPERVIGRRTEACIVSGVFYSAIDSIDGIVARIRKEWGRPDALVVATGGLAARILPYAHTVDRHEPFLTLFGLDLAGTRAAR